MRAVQHSPLTTGPGPDVCWQAVWQSGSLAFSPNHLLWFVFKTVGIKLIEKCKKDEIKNFSLRCIETFRSQCLKCGITTNFLLMIVKIPDYPQKHFCILTTSYFCVYLVKPKTWQQTRDFNVNLSAGLPRTDSPSLPEWYHHHQDPGDKLIKFGKNASLVTGGGVMTVPDSDRLAGTLQECNRAGELESWSWVIVCFPPWSPLTVMKHSSPPQSSLATLLAPLNEWLTGACAGWICKYWRGAPALGQVSHSIGLTWKLGPAVTWLSNQLELIISWLGSHQDLTGSRII